MACPLQRRAWEWTPLPAGSRRLAEQPQKQCNQLALMSGLLKCDHLPVHRGSGLQQPPQRCPAQCGGRQSPIHTLPANMRKRALYAAVSHHKAPCSTFVMESRPMQDNGEIDMHACMHACFVAP